ncbi:radical SAM protein [Anaerocolumna xylanovorans]|uniref:Radical SAM core domain-containing protein n=1 Tax=Anaerocolumna xylanovorans DSM 12503 TaxID=1121345 RepID=A0A1M7Y8Z1_9FIRM|nr:radical SAM protein [Anaerocolumna xylanovorans]SHO49105.1 uncharacterized protein SAMN02745217_02128 [Anaerocolumna xylanovorans DSM 12503]
MYTLSLEIINRCNLNCSYCYLGEKKNSYMNIETAKGAINIAIHEAKKQYDKTLLVYFIGGEPLMAYSTMKEIVYYVIQECSCYGLLYKFSTTINGTLLTNKIAEFLTNYNFDVKLSLDGPEYVHDINRRDYADKGSYSLIAEKQSLFKKYEIDTGKKISVAHVITRNNYNYFMETFKFLIDSGFTKIETAIDYHCEWPEKEKKELSNCVEEVFKFYIDYLVRTSKEIYWNLFAQYIKAYVTPVCFYFCKAGLCTAYVATDGGIYTCAEIEKFKIGSANIGLNVPKIREIAYAEDKTDLKCTHCVYVEHCKTRGCIAANYLVNKDIYKSVEINCFMTKVFYSLIEKNLTEQQLQNIRNAYERGNK